MSIKRILSLLSLSLFIMSGSRGQNTATFNGKSYLVYPQTISMYKGNTISFYEYNQRLAGLEFPPVIGAVKDGEYLIYSNQYDLVTKGKGRFDTVMLVYGTCTIRDNKKEGNAYVYNLKDQKELLAVVPYKNDLIDGELKLSAKIKEMKRSKKRKRYAFSHEYENEYVYIPDNKGKLVYDQNYYVLNYKEGILDGLVKYYRITRKDTLLITQMNVKGGKKEGPYRYVSYYRHKGKIKMYYEVIGQYVQDKKEGEWIRNSAHHGKSYTKEYYHVDSLRYERHYDESGRLYTMTSYGRDSVLKYVPGYLNEKRIPHVGYSYARKKDFIQFFWDASGVKTFTYVIDNYARASYEEDGSFRDTVIMDHLFRLQRFSIDGNSVETYSSIDTCRDYSVEETGDFYFCESQLWTKIYNKKGELKSFTKHQAFDKFNFTDSLSAELQETKKLEKSEEQHFYERALDYRFANTVITKGDNKGCRIFFKVKGGYRDGSIIQFIQIPTTYDSITLVDTLMAGGKFLYTYDTDFQSAYAALFAEDENVNYEDYHFEEEAYEIIRSTKRHRRGKKVTPPSATVHLNELIYRYFNIKPVLHKSVFLGKKMYTGSLELHMEYVKEKKISETSARVYEIESLFSFVSKKFIIEIKIDMDEKGTIMKRGNFVLPSSRMNFEISDGLFSGSVEFYDLFKNATSVNTYYISNRLEGMLSFSIYSYKREELTLDYYEYSDYGGNGSDVVTKDNIFPIQNSSIQFRNGQKHGQWLFMTPSGGVSEFANFRNGVRNGMQSNWYMQEGYNHMHYLGHAVNDTVNGEGMAFAQDGLPYYKGYFIKGLPHGTFTSYFPDDTSKYFRQKFQFDHGLLVGDYVEYRDSNNLALIVHFDKKDSLLYSVFDDDESEGYMYEMEVGMYSMDGRYMESLFSPVYRSGEALMDRLFNYPSVKRGLYSYYYKSGTVFKTGYKKWENPIGKWKFYREGKDRLYKEIDFRDSALSWQGTDTMFSYGLVKTYYDDGRLMFVGYATDKSSAYSCESGADMPIEEDYYLEFYDTIGRPLLVNGNGMIKELQANGYVLKEGQVINYLKQGIWVYYTKFGLPEAIGSYKDGKKTGRWLKGDLGGLNIDDHICYMSDEEFQSWISMFGGNLNLTEEFYVDGKMVSSNQVNTVKR